MFGTRTGRACCVLAPAVLMAVTGCRPFRAQPQNAPVDTVTQQDAAQVFPQRQAESRDAIVVVHMQFDVLRVEFPADAVHHSAKTWNHVNEWPTDPQRCALLRRNGFRVGTAPADAWPGLKAVFETCGSKVIRATHVVQQGVPLTIELGPVSERETIFQLTADNRLIGSTFEEGDKYLHLDYALDRANDGTTLLQMTPEIYSQDRSVPWRVRSGEIAGGPEYQGKVFRQLSYSVKVKPGEFLVIGPDPDATPASVGHRFLTREVGGRKQDTILCVTPRPFRTDMTNR